MIYSGFDRVACEGAPLIRKPAAPGVLVAKMEELILGDAIAAAASERYTSNLRRISQCGEASEDLL
jgi:hypothetical protein